MQSRPHNRRRRGVTLMELVVVLGVIGVVMGAIWWSAAKTRESQRQNDAVAELNTIAQNIATLMAGRTFSQAVNTDITASLISAEAIPSSYINAVTATAVDHPWRASSVTVTVRTTTVAKDTYRITFSQVSRGGCIALLTGGVNCQAGQAGCPVKAYAAGTTKTCTPGLADCTGTATGTGWQVLGATEINDMCAANSYTNGTNSVSFDYSTL